ncbi:MAG: D-cysteine desulfhydrase family protein [Acidobacteriota bacterium]|nr:D-cysteine desulfhydrase family protein [Acidobacteriota bacterium]
MEQSTLRATSQAAIDRLHAIPRLSFGHYPTPIEELLRLRTALIQEVGIRKVPHLFIKRDDYTGPGFGGNKVRKLEHVLAKAIADGAEAVITCGGLKSNHARVTAAMCARLGLRCVLVLNEPAHELTLKPASLRADELYGAEIHRVGNRDERNPTMEMIAARLRSEGKNVVVIPLGASIPLGAIGFVKAVEEGAAQLKTMSVRPDYVFHSSSSGGTQAGLVAGDQLFGLAAKRIIGVSADDPSDSISAEVGRIIHGIGQLLKVEFDKAVTVLDEYVGPGYGIDSPASVAAIELLARNEGLMLDPVYSAKAMAALIDWIKQGKFDENDNVLFWHTGGQLALFYAVEDH